MKIVLFNKNSLRKIENLIMDYQFNDFRAYRALSKDAFKKYLFYRIKNLLEGNNKAIIAEDGKETVGLVILEFLPWDTKHFRMKMARISYLMANKDYSQALAIKNKLLSSLFELCRKEKIVYLSCRIDINDISSIHALEMNGFRLMDTLVTFAFIKGKHKIPEIKTIYPVRKCRAKDLPHLMEIAEKSFTDDRFHLDPCILKEKADSLYSEWIKNSFEQKETIFVAVSGNKPRGFLTYKLYKDLAKITGYKIMGRGLMAVEREAKGAIISLMKATFKDVRKNYDCVEYDTRLNNYEVIHICQKLGLDLVRAKYTFHKWLINSCCP